MCDHVSRITQVSGGSISGATRAGVPLLLLQHSKEGSYERSDLKKKEPLAVFPVISVGFVQGALCYYQPAPFIPHPSAPYRLRAQQVLNTLNQR